MSRKVLEGKASEQEYLHKDFHGALSFAVDYVEERFGRDGLNEFLERVARNVYRPLIESVRSQGLQALAEHWEDTFATESAEYAVERQEDTLSVTVSRCPAIAHMAERGYRVARHFCETTRIVNETIARLAGCESEVEYDQQKGACVQRFRKGGSA